MSLKLTIEAGALHRLVYNSLLFDTSSAKAFEICDGFLKMNTSDGQVYVEDLVELAEEFYPLEAHWIMSAKMAKLLEGDLRKEEDVLDVEVSEDGFHVLKSYDISYGEYAQQSELFNDDGHTDGSLTFAINPDRIRKLALLQPRDYPVAMKARYIDGVDPLVLLFKKGPTVRGTYACLDYYNLKDTAGSSEHLW